MQSSLLAKSLIAGLALASLAALLPGAAGARYAQVVHPGLIFLSGLLSLWIASAAQGPTRRAFVLLAAFFISYGLLNVDPIDVSIQASLGGNFLEVIFVWQIATYASLLWGVSTVILASPTRHLNERGIVYAVILAVIAVGVIAFAIPEFMDRLQVDARQATLYLLVRIFDMAALLLLSMALLIDNPETPLRTQTFRLIIAGIIASIMLTYLYELFQLEPLSRIAVREFHKGTPLDSLYIYGYWLVLIGLLAYGGQESRARPLRRWGSRSL